MMASPTAILVDTNVWLDYFMGGRSGHDDALNFINAAIEHDVCLLHASLSAKDLYYLVSSGLKRTCRQQNGGMLTEAAATTARETAWACLESMNNLSASVGCDQSDIWVAEKQRDVHDDFEDDLIIAAAMRSNADLLVTNDEKLLLHCPVAALCPADAVKLLRQQD